MTDLNRILTERLAIVGGTGSGKSYTARGLVERVLGAGGRVGVIDPTGVWYGLRMKPDGRGAGFPVVMFGGDHSDVPLNETAGRVIGQAVASTHQSWVIDTSALKSKAAERRFMLDFLDSIFEANREDLTLVVDEADRFSPQRMNPESARLHERMEEIVRRGRVRGFTPWLITQRPASLNKDVLSQATAMICMRMTGKHDRDAMAAVIEGQADKSVAKAIVDAMPRHKVGSGLVWAPQQDILAPVQFPKIMTADTMRAPKPGERRAEKKLPAIDIGALREQLVTVEAEAKANDPKVLRAEIAKLKAHLLKVVEHKTNLPVVVMPDEKAILKARQEGFADGLKALAKAEKQAQIVFSKVDSAAATARDAWEALQKTLAMEPPKVVPPRPSPGITHQQKPFVSLSPAARLMTASDTRNMSTNGSLPKAERLILTVLAQHGEVPVERVAAIAGYAVKGGGFNNALGSLRSKGYIQGLKITDAGLEALGPFDPLPTGEELLRHWMGRVGKAERSILEAASRGLSDKESIAREAGYEPTGGGFNNALGRLRTLGLISGRGAIELHEDLR